MNKISIIIPIYNEAKLLLHIEQNASQSILFEIIIVDGGSTDNSQKKLIEQRCVTLVTTEKEELSS
jgi:glycosyltransferase involved in cell wall biosynthesis